MWAIASAVAGAWLGPNSGGVAPGPFSMQDEQATLRTLEQAGFRDGQVTAVKKTGQIATAALAATGFVQGLPLAAIIQQKDPSLLPKMEAALAHEFSQQLGDQPLQAALHAWVFEAHK